MSKQIKDYDVKGQIDPTDQVVVQEDGGTYKKVLGENIGGGSSGTGGKSSPNYTGVTNVTAIPMSSDLVYIQSGNAVSVKGTIAIETTDNFSAVDVDFDLPVACTDYLTALAVSNSQKENKSVPANASIILQSNTKARLSFNADTTGFEQTYIIDFSYTLD